MKLSHTIIYLIGIPAVEKHTTAKEIGRLTGAKVVDNQLINLPVFTVVGYDGTDAFPFPKGAGEYIENIHRAVLAVYSRFLPARRQLCFYKCLGRKHPFGPRVVSPDRACGETEESRILSRLVDV